MDLERRKLEERLKREKEEEEKERREAAAKAKYDAAFRDGEDSKAKEYADRAKAEAERKRM